MLYIKKKICFLNKEQKNIKRCSEICTNTITSDAKIILNFLSFTGIPNIKIHQSENRFSKFRKIFQYILVIYFFCIFLASELYRVKKYLKYSKSVAVAINIIGTAILSLLMKLFLIIKVKYLNSSA